MFENTYFYVAAFYVASVSLDVVTHNAGTTVVDPQELAVAVSGVTWRQGGATGQ
jgi:hypothetical protein